MAMGLLMGAMAGGAQAANEIADNSLQARREKALMDLKERYQIRAEGRAAEREDQMWERERGAQVEDRDFAASENRWSVNRQAGAAAQRAAMGAWQVAQDAEGNAVRFNAATGETAPIEGGLAIGSSGEMSDRDNARVNFLNDQVDRIQKRLTEDPAMDDDTRQILEGQLESHISELNAMTSAQGAGAAAGGSLEDRLAARLGATRGTSDDPERRPGILEEASQANQQQQQDSADAERRREIDSQLTEISRAVSSRASTSDRGLLPGGTAAVTGRDSALTPEQARAYLQQLEEAESYMSDRQRRTAATLARQLLSIADD